MPTLRIRFVWLGTPVEVAADNLAFIDFLRGLLHALEAPTVEPALRFGVRLEGDSPALETDGTHLPLAPANPGLHAWSAILGNLAGRIGDRWLLHGAALSRNGRGLFLAAPSGFGKTTLALTLADRGFGLLADDLAPLHRERRRLEPFPRSLSLREGTRALLPPETAERALGACRWRTPDDAEWLVDPVRLFGASPEAVPPACVVLLRPPDSPDGVRRYVAAEVLFVPGLEPSREELRADPDLEAAAPSRSKSGLVEIRARSEGGLTRWIEREGPRIALASKLPSLPTAFEGLPRTRRVTIFESAIEIAQELHNRASESSLGREFAGRETDLVTELAATLSGCRCWSVGVGALEPTVEAISALFEGNDHDA